MGTLATGRARGLCHVALQLVLLAALACSVVTVGPPRADVSTEAWIQAAVGGELVLADGARLEVPPRSLRTDGQVEFRRVEAVGDIGEAHEYTLPVGDLYEVDLGTLELAAPLILEIPFDRTALPLGVDPGHVFLSYFDESQAGWVYAGGVIDPKQDVIRLTVDHASFWQPATWNWPAWIAVLNKSLSGSLLEMVEAVQLLTEECRQENGKVYVDSDRSRSLIQGCIDLVGDGEIGLRVINPKSFFLEVSGRYLGPEYFRPTMLAPGESLRFSADVTDPSPLVVVVEMTQEAGVRLILHMLITMMPGANQIGIQGEAIACLTERLADASHFFSAAENLALEQDGAAASEDLVHFLLDDEATGRFLMAARGCAYGPASTWSVEGLRQIGGAVGTIVSATDLVSNYLAGNGRAELAFSWGRQTEAEAEALLLQACLEQGYACILLPWEVTGPVAWLRGVEYDPAWEGQGGPATEYLGLNPDRGTTIIAPLGGTVEAANPGGFNLNVLLPSNEEIQLSFRIAGYHEFEWFIDDSVQVSKGDRLGRYTRVIPWTPGLVGPDFEYPGIVQVSVGYDGDYSHGTPIYPVIRWDPRAGLDPERDVERLMTVDDCRRSTYRAIDGPRAIFEEAMGLLRQSGIQVDPEPESFMDLSPPLALWPPKVSAGSSDTLVSGEGDARRITECIYLVVWNLPSEGANTIVYESSAEGGAWRFLSPIKRFIVWTQED